MRASVIGRLAKKLDLQIILSVCKVNLEVRERIIMKPYENNILSSDPETLSCFILRQFELVWHSTSNCDLF